MRATSKSTTGSYEADDVECKDGNCDMTLDKDFKITNKKKEG